MIKNDDEKVRALNLLMWLQVVIYATDDCENIKWFYNHRTKNALKNVVDAITKEHGKVIMALWEEDGVQMELVTKVMDRFTKLIGELDYYKLLEINKLIELYNAGKLDEILTETTKLKSNE